MKCMLRLDRKGDRIFWRFCDETGARTNILFAGLNAAYIFIGKSLEARNFWMTKSEGADVEFRVDFPGHKVDRTLAKLMATGNRELD